MSGRAKSFYKSSYGMNNVPARLFKKNTMGPSTFEKSKPLSNYSDHFKMKANLSFFKS